MKISRRNFLAVAGAAAAAAALTACGGSSASSTSTASSAAASSAAASGAADGAEKIAKVALTCDTGTIDDESFNQACWAAVSSYMGDNCQYYIPDSDASDEDRETMIRQAVNDGADVIVCVGYLYGASLAWAADQYPDVKFIALDVAKGDLLEAGVAKAGESYDYNPDNWDLEKYVDMSNVYCAIYQEELCGYMAGYAAVKLGYKSLGFLGGMAVPAVIRYGYGFVQGVDAAAADLGLSDVTVKYVYGGQFFGDADITAVMDTWYAGGTEVVFACGGGIYTSAVDAAKKANGKVIGVDVDQAGVIANYAGVDGLTVTSAMKGLYPATYDTLNDVIINGNWANYVGKIATLGLVSADDPEANYVQIPMGEGTQWSDSFTEDDYKAMVADMYNGVITVSNDISKAASDFATVITVDDQGAIKG